MKGETLSYRAKSENKPPSPRWQSAREDIGALGEQCAGPPYAAYYNEDVQNLDVEKGAVPEDARMLTRVSKRAFESDVRYQRLHREEQERDDRAA